MKKTKDGTELVSKTDEAFSVVADSTGKVGELVGEIAAASNEQAQGIDQVNKAVAEMDKVVQQNASNAEESAAASEEMSAQANRIKGMVNQLASMVGGIGKKSPGGRNPVKSPSGGGAFNSRAPVNGRAGGKNLVVQKTRELNPNQIIPLDDDDLMEF